MQAIVTKYLPATSTRPSRIKAWCDRGSITIGSGPYVCGGMPEKGTTCGFCFVSVPRSILLIRAEVDAEEKANPSSWDGAKRRLQKVGELLTEAGI